MMWPVTTPSLETKLAPPNLSESMLVKDRFCDGDLKSEPVSELELELDELELELELDADSDHGLRRRDLSVESTAVSDDHKREQTIFAVLAVLDFFGILGVGRQLHVLGLLAVLPVLKLNDAESGPFAEGRSG
jgi:hypothetical protein